MSTKEGHDMETISDAPDATPEPVTEPTKRRSRTTNVVLAAAIVVGLVAAIACAVLAFGAGSSADDARARTHALGSRMNALQERASAIRQRRDHLVELREAAAARVMDLGDALAASEDAENAYVDVTNRAADQHNAGDPAGAAATFHGAGQAALDRLAEKVAAADRALVAVQTAINDLEEDLR
jgi:hypothetical protein